MPPSKTRTSDIASRRRLHQTRADWLDFFRDALNGLLNTDTERIKELTDDEAASLVASAVKIADASIEAIEARFPGI